MINLLKQMSIRKKQAYAALCLANYCMEKHIFHPGIKELIEHLLSLLITDNIVKWESTGSRLVIAGRGDPLPDSVKTIVPEHIYDVFYNLTECVIEVGIVDMYGASTEYPLKFLLECIEILQASNVNLPDINLVFNKKDTKEDDAWGEPINHKDYEKIIFVYNQIMSS